MLLHPNSDKLAVKKDGSVWTLVAKRTSRLLTEWRELKRWDTKQRKNHLVDIPFSLMQTVEPGTNKRNKSVTAVICLECYLGRTLYDYEQACHINDDSSDNSYGNLKAQCALNNFIDELYRNHTAAHTHNKKTSRKECQRAIKRLEDLLPTL
mgnify:FL=1|tara:strand:+ start:182 stop:637 length:456 start_codon:yes stop_codon:yes gene_type:complete